MAAVGPDNKSAAIALLFMGCTFVGWNEAICLAGTTLLVKDQREIGIAGGLGSAIRSAITAVVTAVYVTVLTNKLETNIVAQVPAALAAAGLPTSSIAAFIGAISVGTPAAFAAVPGVTSKIIATGLTAYKQANSDAFHTVYLTTLAFTGLAVMVAFFQGNTEHTMTENVAATLANENDTLTKKGDGLAGV
jgi:hypothetical protein